MSVFCLCILENCCFSCNEDSFYIWMLAGISIMERYILWQQLTLYGYVHIICSQTYYSLIKHDNNRNFLFATNSLMEHTSLSLFLRRLFVRQEFMLLHVLDVCQSFGVIKSLYQLHPLSILLHIMWTLCVL